VYEFPEDVADADPHSYMHNREMYDRLLADLDLLEDGWFVQGSGGGFDVHVPDAHASLLLDGRVRYGYEGDELTAYFFELLTADKELPELPTGR
jgi:hypothetical protein